MPGAVTRMASGTGIYATLLALQNEGMKKAKCASKSTISLTDPASTPTLSGEVLGDMNGCEDCASSMSFVALRATFLAVYGMVCR